MDDLKKLVAFVFQRKGADTMEEKEFYMMLSFELGWLTPKEGLKIVEQAFDRQLLKKQGELICPTFDFKNEEIPLGFKYDNKKLGEMTMDLLSRIVEQITQTDATDEKTVREDIQTAAKQLHVFPEVAAILIAKKKDIDVDEFIEEAKTIIHDM
jgi:hypothetical protein